MEDFLSVIIPTHCHPFELNITLMSLSKQKGIDFNNFEVIVVNTNPDHTIALKVVRKYKNKMNIRFVNIKDPKGVEIKNATYGLNLGVKKYARGNLVMLVVDDARPITHLVINKTFDAFRKFGKDIAVVTWPYHFYKHSSTPGFTVEECRENLKKTRYKRDLYDLFNYAVHTNITKSGIHNEATWLGITKENFIKVGGHNETSHHGWSDYNLCLLRRLTRNPPKDNIQIPGKVNDHWGKIGIGLRLIPLDGEADFHIHHKMGEAKRDFSILKQTKINSWKQFEKQGDCIIANKNFPWGEGESEEIFL